MTSLRLADLNDPAVPANDQGMRRPWTIEEDMLLLTKGPVYGYATVAEQLGRTGWAGVQRRARLKAANSHHQNPTKE